MNEPKNEQSYRKRIECRRLKVRKKEKTKEEKERTKERKEGCATAIALWFRLRLPSCGPGFESQAHRLSFLQFILLKLE